MYAKLEARQRRDPRKQAFPRFIVVLKFHLKKRSPVFGQQYFYKWQLVGQDGTLAQPYIYSILLVFLRLAAVLSDVFR